MSDEKTIHGAREYGHPEEGHGCNLHPEQGYGYHIYPEQSHTGNLHPEHEHRAFLSPLPEAWHVEVMEHEGAAVGNFQFAVREEVQEAFQKTEQFLEELGEQIVKNGGYIGHLKAVAHPHGEGMRFSVTGGKPEKRELKPDGVWVEGVAIVFHLTSSQLKELLQEEIQKQKTK